MNRERELARTDDLLSAYIDGELDPATKARLETDLAHSPDLRRQLETLRQTIGLVQSLPPVEAPHNFLITAAMVGDTSQQKASRRRSRSILHRWLAPALSFATAVSTLLLVATLSSGLLGGQFADDRLAEPVDSEQAVGVAEVPESALLPEDGEAEEPAFLTAPVAEPTDAPSGARDNDATPSTEAESAPAPTATVADSADAAPTSGPGGSGGVGPTAIAEVPVAGDEENDAEATPSLPAEEGIVETPPPSAYSPPEPEVVEEETPPDIVRSTEAPSWGETLAQTEWMVPAGLALLTLILAVSTTLAWLARRTR
jgi:hypothetical protein